MRILLIEDDPDLNNQIKNSLEDSGYSVDSAYDGEEGHFLGDTEPYDAVVLDLGLPKIENSYTRRSAAVPIKSRTALRSSVL